MNGNYIVAGATGGTGSALARRLAGEGSSVFLLGRNEEKLKTLAGDLQVGYTVCDLTDTGAVEMAIAEGADELGGLDGIANIAGSILLKPAHLTSEAEWLDTLSTNLTSAFAVVKGASKIMMKSGGGSIALVSSAAARTGLPSHEAIAAAKAGVIGLTLSAAATYAPYNIRVNCVAPGLVESPLTEKITSNPVSLKVSLGMHALGRMGKPDDVASALVWLLDASNNWVTGQVIGVDGGLGSLQPRPSGSAK